ncbi:glycosyltransferase [Candidatus Dojkabacteria bacterium]|nr:glycosyltransferase [Candidatus Dojkabacteria bacterium]
MISLRKQTPEVSVVVPYYNMGQYIDSLLESLDKQTYRDFEIILVNDGSNESASLQKLEEVQDSRPEISIINQDNKGLPGARNTGIKESKGKYICCIDPDDKYHPSYFEKAVDLLDNSKDLDIVSSWIKTFGDSESTIKLQRDEFPAMLYENNICVASMFRKKMWRKVQGYDEKMRAGYEDWEFWINCLAHKARAITIEEPLFNYRITKDSMLNTLRKDPAKILDNLTYIYNKHRGLYAKYVVGVLQGKDKEIQHLSRINRELQNMGDQ